jgi:acetylglutamate kinase
MTQSSAKTYTMPPAVADIAALAEAALAGIPEPLRRHLAGVAIAVEELADDETLEAMGIESPYDLTGLYRGVPLHRRGGLDVPPTPDLIVLYRQAILLEWIETDVDLASLVANVMIHEAAHHFGFSDAEIAALERG